jgi:hypothetical protein
MGSESAAGDDELNSAKDVARYGTVFDLGVASVWAGFAKLMVDARKLLATPYGSPLYVCPGLGACLLAKSGLDFDLSMADKQDKAYGDGTNERGSKHDSADERDG